MNENLKLIADNQLLFDALKDVLLSRFNDADIVPASMSDEQIGQITRARIDGIKRIESVFADIARLRAPKDTPPPVNRAR